MKASVYIATSLDGFIAREDGTLNWLPGSGDGDEIQNGNDDLGFNAFMDSVDVLVMGRNTYELVLSSGLWPYVDKRVIVLSNTLSKAADHLLETVEIRSALPQDLYNELEESGARHLYIDGGENNSGLSGRRVN